MKNHKKKMANRILSWLLGLVFLCNLVLGTLPVRAAALSSAWDGSLDFTWYDEYDRQDEYHIQTPAQWAALAWICSEDLPYLMGDYQEATNYNVTSITGEIPENQYCFEGVQFYLDNDLDMGGSYDVNRDEWTGPNYYPIGGEYRNDGYTHEANQDIFYSCFYGSFDGQGHMVSNIYCSRGWSLSAGSSSTWYQCAGLFGRVGAPDGAVAPQNDIVIENVAVTGFVETSRSVGGIVGKTLHVAPGYTVTVRNCLNFATVTNSDAKGVGGIVGSAWNGSYIINCANFGLVTCDRQNGGGIAGSSEATCISCYNVGDVSKSVYNHGQAYGTDNNGTVLTNFYYAADSTIDAGYPAIYSTRPLEQFDYTGLSSTEMRNVSFLYRLNQYADEYGWWVFTDDDRYDGYPVPEVFGDGTSGIPPEPAGTYWVRLEGDDHYTVNLDGSEIDYRSGMVFSVESKETKHLTIAMDEEYVFGQLTTKGDVPGTAGVLTRIENPDYVSEYMREYNLDGVSGDTTLTVESLPGCHHDYQEADRQDATCYDEGYVEYKCSKCGDTYTETLEAGEHVYQTVTIDPTGTERGYTEYTCERCGYSYVGDYTWLVSFDYGGVAPMTEQIVPDGDCAALPEEPVHPDGDLFAGWYTDEAHSLLYDFSRPVTRSMVLYADWSRTAYHVGFYGENAAAFVGGERASEAIVKAEGGSVTFTVEPDTGYELVGVTAEKISPDSIWDGSIASGFAGGSGTASDPYLISSAAQLAYLAQQVNSSKYTSTNISYGRYFRLTCSIDLNNISWTPIGTSSSQFAGFFYGDGHTVTNLYINAPSADNQGLFGYVDGTEYAGQEQGEIHDLNVFGSVTGKCAVGGIAGYAEDALISGCTNYAAVSATGVSGFGAGGIAGVITAGGVYGRKPVVENCLNYGTVNGIQAGGIAGGGIGATISGCLNYGDISSSRSDCAGGIVGNTQTGNHYTCVVSNCGNHGTVSGTGTGTTVGGVVGRLTVGDAGPASLTGCYNVGAVTTKGAYAGGLAGQLSAGTTGMTVENCYNRGSVSAAASTVYVGGIAGHAEYTGTKNGFTLQNCYSIGLPVNAIYRGGIVGRLQFSSLTNVKNNYYFYNGFLPLPAWTSSYTWTTTTGNAQQIKDDAEMQALELGSAFKADTDHLNDGYPVLTWQGPVQGPIGDTTLTDHGNGTYTLSNVTDDMMVYMTAQKRSYPVSFVTEYGTAPKAQTVEHGGTATEPSLLFADNYRLEGWFLDKDCTQPYHFSEPVTRPLTLYANWVFLYYTVQFNINDGTGSNFQQRLDSEPWLAERPEDPVREGYGFTGWYTSYLFNELYDFDALVTKDMTLWAGWKSGEFTVTIDPDNGDEPERQTVKYEKYAEKPTADPEKEGYVFAGWYYEEQGDLTNPFYFSTKVIKGDTKIRAKWVRALPVSFEAEPEEAQIEVSLRGVPAAPTDEGSYLLGEGLEYTYQVSAPGYQTASGALVPEWKSIEEDPAEEPKDSEEPEEAGEPEETGEPDNEDGIAAQSEEAEEETVPTEEETEGKEETPAPIVIRVALTPIQPTAVRFESGIPVSDGNQTITEMQVEPGKNLVFWLRPELGQQVTGISLAAEPPEASAARADRWDGLTADADWQGAGTQDDPYLITSAAQLAGIAWMVNQRDEFLAGKYFLLMTDIDLAGHTWTPIGGNNSEYFQFRGVFDGNGHTISNLYFENRAARYVGLFGYTFGAEIYDLTLANADVTGDSYAGALVGYGASGTEISGCSVSGSVKGTHTYDTSTEANYSRIGGLAGRLDGKMADCENQASVSGDYCVGGLVGSAESGTVSISGSHNTGCVTGGRYVGGLIGMSEKTTGCTLSQLENTGAVSGSSDTGGIAGNTVGAVMTNCSNRGEVSGGQNLGGLVGLLQSTQVSGSYNTGAVALAEKASTGAAAGGLAGYAKNNSTLKNSYSAGAVTGETSAYLGGLAGRQENGTVFTNCYWLDTAAGTGFGEAGGTGSVQSATSLRDYQMKYSSFLTDLGSGFALDFSGQNGGYPVFSGQNELLVSTYPDGSWRVTVEQPQENLTVIVSADQIRYDVTWDEEEAYTITPQTAIPLTYGEEFLFTIALNPGYEKIPGKFQVTANGKELTAQEDGTYVIPAVSESQVVAVSGYEKGTYTVKLDPNGGILSTSGWVQKSVTYPNRVPTPSTPARMGGYQFTGWFLDKYATQPYDFDAPVTSDLTLYAGWYFKDGMYMVYDLNLPEGASASGAYAGQTKIQRMEEQGKNLADPPEDPSCVFRSDLITGEFLYWSETKTGGPVNLAEYIVPELTQAEMNWHNNQGTLPTTTLYAQWTVSTQPNTPSGGDGQSLNISSADQLLDMADQLGAGMASAGMALNLQNDITLPESVNIGSDSLPFQGTLNGNGYTIVLANSQTGGLFGYLDEGTVVENVTIRGTVNGGENDSRGDSLGMLADISYGIIQNCAVTGSVTGVSGQNYVGGVVGSNYGDLLSLDANISVSGVTPTGLGGIAGRSGETVETQGTMPKISTRIEDCTVEAGSIINLIDDTLHAQNTNTQMGGIVGRSVGTITGCVNQGEFQSSKRVYRMGGISGNHSSGDISDCRNESDITNATIGGGIVSELSLKIYLETVGTLFISNCVNTGSIEVSSQAGGIVAWATDQGILAEGNGTVMFENCRNMGKIVSKNTSASGSYGIGGILGLSDVDVSISYCVNLGDLSADGSCTAVGGLAGECMKGAVAKSYSTGSIEAANSTHGVGGLVGSMSSGIIDDSYWYGEVLKVGPTNKNTGYADGGNEAQLTNFYYFNDADQGMGSIPAPEEGSYGKPASAFQSGEVSYLLDGGDPNGGVSTRSKNWSLLDEMAFPLEERYPTLVKDAQSYQDEPDYEYYMVTLKGEVEYAEDEGVTADRSHNDGGSATLTEAGGETISIASSSDTADAHAGRTLALKVDAVPNGETWEDEPEEVLDEEGKVTAYIIRTWHWEVEDVTAEYTLNAGGSGAEAVSGGENGPYTFTLSQEGNYVVTVTFKAVYDERTEEADLDEEEEEEPEEPEEPKETEKPEEPEEPEQTEIPDAPDVPAAPLPEEPFIEPDHGSGDGDGDGSGNGQGDGNGDGNGDGRGDGTGNGNGRGDGDNGSGNEAGGGDGGEGSEVSIEDSSVPMAGDADQSDASVPVSGELASESEALQNAQEADSAEVLAGDRSETPNENHNEGQQGGSQEGGSGQGGEESIETADVADAAAKPKIFEVLKENAGQAGCLLLLLALLVIAITGAVRRGRRYRREEREDSQ